MPIETETSICESSASIKSQIGQVSLIEMVAVKCCLFQLDPSTERMEFGEHNLEK